MGPSVSRTLYPQDQITIPNVDGLHMMPDLIAGSDNHELVTPGRGLMIQSGENVRDLFTVARHFVLVWRYTTLLYYLHIIPLEEENPVWRNSK